MAGTDPGPSEAETARLRAQLASALDLLASHQAELTTARAEQAAIRAELAASRAELASLREHASAANAHASELRARVDELLQEMAKQADRISELDVVDAPVTTVQARGYHGEPTFWFVVDHAGRTLTALELAEAVGDDARRTTLRRRRSTTTSSGLGLLALGLGGGAAAVWGLGPTAGGYTAVAGSAICLAAGGVVLGSTVRDRHPSSAWTRDEAVTTVQAHNAAARERLFGAP